MTQIRLIDYIDHMIKFASETIEFTANLNKDKFLTERIIQQAVCMNIITIGEISTLISKNYPSFVKTNNSLPWADISGMRHRLVHGYLEIDLDVVWTTATMDIPSLLEILPSIRKKAEDFL